MNAMISIEPFNFLFSAQMKTDRSLKKKAEGKYAVISFIKATDIVHYGKYNNTYKAENEIMKYFIWCDKADTVFTEIKFSAI